MNMDHGAWSASSTISECQNACYRNSSCTAVDWVLGDPVGNQCWLHGRWSGGTRNNHTGVDHYVISRTDCSKLIICYFVRVACLNCSLDYSVF